MHQSKGRRQSWHCFVWLLFLLIICLTGCAPSIKPSHEQMDSLKQPSDEKTVYQVERIVDGDTIYVSDGKRTEKIRFIGVNTPETNHPEKGVEPFGREAKAYTTKRLAGQQIVVETDVDLRDRYGRLLAYIYLKDGTFYNEELIREGYAQVMTIPPNDRFAERFLLLQREAKEAKRGLWADH